MRKIIVGISDTHGGHRLGLMQPTTTLPREPKGGGYYEQQVQLTECQAALWEWQEGCIGWVRRLAGHDPITLVHLGDPAHGNARMNELVSTRMADQIIIARDNLWRWKNGLSASRTILCVGTDVHEFMEGSASILIREMAGENIELVNHGMINVGGFLIDAAHHGPPPGRRAWLQGNEARYSAKSQIMDDIISGKRPPDLIWRGHVHSPIIENVRIAGKIYWMLIAPPFCFPGAYALKVTRSVSSVSYGIQVLEIVDGRLAGEPIELIQKIDLRQTIKI